MAKRTGNDWPAIAYGNAYYDIHHVAQHLGVTVRTLERWRDRGDLVITHLSPKRRVVSCEALLRFELSRRGSDIGDLIGRCRSQEARAQLLTLLATPPSPPVPDVLGTRITGHRPVDGASGDAAKTAPGILSAKDVD